MMATPSVDSGQVERNAVFEAGRMLACRILCGGDDHFFEAPVSLGLRIKHDPCIRTSLVHRLASRTTRDLLEERERGFDEARFCVGFKPRSPRGPGRIAAELVLLGRWNIALGSIG